MTYASAPSLRNQPTYHSAILVAVNRLAMLWRDKALLLIDQGGIWQLRSAY